MNETEIKHIGFSNKTRTNRKSTETGIFDSENPNNQTSKDTESSSFQIYRNKTTGSQDFDDSGWKEDFDVISDDEEGEIIPANTFFPERTNILKKGQWIKFKKWGEDP